MKPQVAFEYFRQHPWLEEVVFSFIEIGEFKTPSQRQRLDFLKHRVGRIAFKPFARLPLKRKMLSQSSYVKSRYDGQIVLLWVQALLTYHFVSTPSRPHECRHFVPEDNTIARHFESIKHISVDSVVMLTRVRIPGTGAVFMNFDVYLVPEDWKPVDAEPKAQATTAS